MAINWSKPVQTRDGLAVRILDLDSKVAGYPVIGCVIHPDGQEEVETWTEDGRVTAADDAGAHAWHLVNVPERTVSFFPVLDGGRLCGAQVAGVKVATGYETMAQAQLVYPNATHFIQCVWEDGVLVQAQALNVVKEI